MSVFYMLLRVYECFYMLLRVYECFLHVSKGV